MSEEIWKPVLGFEGLYEVSNQGRVKISKTGKIKKSFIHKSGYVYIMLNKQGKKINKKVHRLVAEVFVPNPLSYPFVNHNDLIKTNNTDDNLEWCCRAYNDFHAKFNGVYCPVNNPNRARKLSPKDIKIIRKLKDTGYTYTEISSIIDVSRGAAHKIVHGKSWAKA